MSGTRVIGPGGMATGGPARVAPGALRDQSFQDIYANQVRMAVLPTDISIVFSVTSDRGPGVFTLDDKATIRMAPGTAKLLFLQIKTAIEAYEKAIGEIKIPAQAAQQIEAHRENITKGLSDQMSPP